LKYWRNQNECPKFTNTKFNSSTYKRNGTKDGVSINSFINSAVAEKISAITTDEYISKRAQISKRVLLEKY